MRVVIAALAALWLPACGGDQSFAEGMAVMCEAATPARIAIEDPVERDRILIAWIGDRLRNDDARAALRAMTAAATPAERARVVRAAAAEAGLARCALGDFLASPPPPRQGRGVAAADPRPAGGSPAGDPEPPVVLDVSPPRLAPGSVEIGEVTTAGALTPDQVRAQLTNLAAVARCYQDARGGDASLRGRLAIDLVVDRAGRATEVRVTGLAEALDACVAAAVEAWTFAPATGPSAVTIQLDLSVQS